MYGVQFEGRLNRSGVRLNGSVRNVEGHEFKTDDPTEAKEMSETVREELARTGWTDLRVWVVPIYWQEACGVR
jgi:putative NADPH-quinone reductase